MQSVYRLMDADDTRRQRRVSQELASIELHKSDFPHLALIFNKRSFQ